MVWSTINVITGPCKCGKGLLRSIHKTDGEGNYETDWNLICPDCSSKYVLEKEVLVGNPDKSLSAVKYVERV